MASIRGIVITNFGEKRVMFRFFNIIDLKMVMEDMPFLFNKHLIVFHKLEEGEDPMQVLHIYALFWVQVHNLLMGFMSKGITRKFGNFIGQFMEYDAALVTR